MKRDPFAIDCNTAISFSGGRTSAYMLWRVLQANRGLPSCASVIFANTGKEKEATLRFVQRCSDEWSVPITWLEYRAGPTFEVVDFARASRAGEPFDQVIAHRGGVLPNVRSPFCSSELKTRTMHRHIKATLAWKEWESMIGIRADEPARVRTFRENPSPEIAAEEIVIPLADVGVSSFDVGAFWEANPFDLELPNHNGKTKHGNCDLCYKKPGAQVLSLIQEEPQTAVWWIAKEAQAEQFATGDGNRFRNDRPSYAQMAKFSADQVDMFDDAELPIACICGD